MKNSIKKAVRLVALVAAIVMVAAPYAQISSLATGTAQAATPQPNTFITGKVLKPDGAPFSLTCMPPPGQTIPPGMMCGVGINLNSGPDNSFWGGTSPDTGAFSIPVAAGKYQLMVNMPPEQMGPYSFTPTYVEVVTGQTKDVGTITPTQKQGHIKGIVKDQGTGLGAPNVAVSAFPMMMGTPEEAGGGGPGPMMMPSNSTTDSGGFFDISVNAGRYSINLDSRPDSLYVRANSNPIDVDVATDTTTVTGIEVLAIKADATITGRVLDETGAQVTLPGSIAARPTSATDFFDYNAPINPPGVYTIKVSSAVTTQYDLVVHMPPGTSYSINGSITVTVIPNGTVTKDVQLMKNNSSIFGKLVSDSGFALSSCKVTNTAQFGGQGFGEVFANNPKAGVFVNAPIQENCTFKLVVGAGEYQFGYHMNPTAGYINKPAPPEPIVVSANQDVEKNITVIAGDATITGQVLDPNGNPFPNAFVDVGNEREINDSFKSGGQEGVGAGGTGQFKGPGGTTSPEEVMKFCSNPGNATTCKNFKMAPGTSGPGGCTDALACTQYCQKNPSTCSEFSKANHDNPLGKKGVAVLGQGAKRVRATGRSYVLAEDVTKGGDGPDMYRDNIIHVGMPTDPNGKFTILVPSGHMYEVGVNLPPDKAGNYLPPKRVQVDLKTTKTASVALQFRTAFGTMRGKVTYPDGTVASRCFVHFWSEDGGNGGSPCNNDGTYSMGYDKGKLHIAADSFDGKTGYKSDEAVVIITTEKSVTQNIALKKMDFQVFQPTSKTFDAAAGSTVTLDNGAQIVIPAGAIAESGDVTISAQPNMNLQTDQNNSLADVGYTLKATDSSGNEITSFNSDVTVTLPYNQDSIDESGLDESMLNSKYVNASTGGWSSVDNNVQDTTENTMTFTTDHFTDYAVVGASIGGKTKQVTASTSGKNVKIAVDGTTKITLKNVKKADLSINTANFGTKVGGQLIVVSNKTKGGDISLYDINGKLKKRLSPFGKSYTGGLQQTVEDVWGGKSKKLDGVSDLIVAPTNGTANALVYSIKDGLTYKPTTLTTGVTGTTGKTTLSTVTLSSGSSTLATLFIPKNDVRAWKLDKKGKLVIDTSKLTASKLKVKAGSVQKITETPKVKSTSPKTCTVSGSTKMTLKGTGFTDSLIALWNGATALAAKVSKNGTVATITLNSSAIEISAVNTLTLVNIDGQAGVAVIRCK